MTPPPSVVAASDIDAYLELHEHKSLLRFLTCGSVDDGKSTLIGRLLYDTDLILEDQLVALEADSKKLGTQGDNLDFALLLDGLLAEREQKITIDVAYRYFSTDRRTFIVADTPGHEQYTRNMVTGASTVDAAVLLVDARQGVVAQTRRHCYLVALLGIRHVVLAVNKLDLMGYSRSVFEEIADSYTEFASRLGLTDVVCVPISALRGDNVTTRSEQTPWYTGPTLLGFLETVEVEDANVSGPLRLPVQLVLRPNLDFRGFGGQIASGTLRVGDPVQVLPSGAASAVARIVTMDGDKDEAVAGESVTVTLVDQIDVSRGGVLCSPDAPAAVADQFEAHIVWFSEHDMLPGRPYLLKIGTRTVSVTLSRPKYTINVDTLEHMAANTLVLNDIGVCNLHLDQTIAFDPYDQNRDMGGFIVIDRLTNDTVGAGMLSFALRRSQNLSWQTIDVTKPARAAIKGQHPCIVWFTGLSGAGKSTIANLLERKLHLMGKHTHLLDGDNIRHGLNQDLGFTEADRVENVRRVAEVARLMVDAGLIVLVSFISPFEAERRLARELVDSGEFCEVFVDTPLAIAEERDTKGLYRKARRGELVNFTGIDSPYEPPDAPEVHLDTTAHSAEEAADLVLASLRTLGVLD